MSRTPIRLNCLSPIRSRGTYIQWLLRGVFCVSASLLTLLTSSTVTLFHRFTAEYVSRCVLGVHSRALASALCLLLRRASLDLHAEVEQKEIGTDIMNTLFLSMTTTNRELPLLANIHATTVFLNGVDLSKCCFHVQKNIFFIMGSFKNLQTLLAIFFQFSSIETVTFRRSIMERVPRVALRKSPSVLARHRRHQQRYPTGPRERARRRLAQRARAHRAGARRTEATREGRCCGAPRETASVGACPATCGGQYYEYAFLHLCCSDSTP